MAKKKIHKVFFIGMGGERMPIEVEYRLRLPTRIEFDVLSVWQSFELIEIRTNVRDEETTYVIGEYIGANVPREKNLRYNEGESA
jgi:hypothetical protein